MAAALKEERSIGQVRVRQAIGKLRHAGIAPSKTTQILQENKAWLQSRIQ